MRVGQYLPRETKGGYRMVFLSSSSSFIRPIIHKRISDEFWAEVYDKEARKERIKLVIAGSIVAVMIGLMVISLIVSILTAVD